MSKLFWHLAITILSVTLLACNTQAKESKLTGHYTYGVEVNVFQPCNLKTAFWVIGPDKIISKIVTQYEMLTSKPYEKIFITLTGEYTSKATDGFAADYDGQVKVTNVIKTRKSSATDCK